jgi:hypothetical protein
MPLELEGCQSDNLVLRTDWKAYLPSTGSRGLVRLRNSYSEQRRLN